MCVGMVGSKEGYAKTLSYADGLIEKLRSDIRQKDAFTQGLIEALDSIFDTASNDGICPELDRCYIIARDVLKVKESYVFDRQKVIETTELPKP